NKQLLEKFNKSQKEIIGQNLLQHVYPADVERAKEEIQKNRKIIYELRVLRGDGSVIHTEVKAYPIIYDGKKCRLLILRDITRRKISESRFLNYHNMMNAFTSVCITLPSPRNTLSSYIILRFFCISSLALSTSAGYTCCNKFWPIISF